MNFYKSRDAAKVVYTCVVGDYDRLYPPVEKDPDTRYIALTDDPDLRAPGWKTQLISLETDLSPSLLNRYCKLFPWKFFPLATRSVYVDGNIRILSSLSRLFDLIDDGYDIALLRHPRRKYVSEEADACVQHKKVKSVDIIEAEISALKAAGYVDRGRLTENNVIVRSHTSKELRSAMEGWWEFIQKYSGRDQMSLHHFLQAENVKSLVLPFNVREPNPFFDIYPHFGSLNFWYERIACHNSARKREGQFHYFKYRLLRKLIRLFERKPSV